MAIMVDILEARRQSLTNDGVRLQGAKSWSSGKCGAMIGIGWQKQILLKNSLSVMDFIQRQIN